MRIFLAIHMIGLYLFNFVYGDLYLAPKTLLNPTKFVVGKSMEKSEWFALLNNYPDIEYALSLLDMSMEQLIDLLKFMEGKKNPDIPENIRRLINSWNQLQLRNFLNLTQSMILKGANIDYTVYLTYIFSSWLDSKKNGFNEGILKRHQMSEVSQYRHEFSKYYVDELNTLVLTVAKVVGINLDKVILISAGSYARRETAFGTDFDFMIVVDDQLIDSDDDRLAIDLKLNILRSFLERLGFVIDTNIVPTNKYLLKELPSLDGVSDMSVYLESFEIQMGMLNQKFWITKSEFEEYLKFMDQLNDVQLYVLLDLEIINSEYTGANEWMNQMKKSIQENLFDSEKMFRIFGLQSGIILFQDKMGEDRENLNSLIVKNRSQGFVDFEDVDLNLLKLVKTHIKKDPGLIRDINAVFWIAHFLFGTLDKKKLNNEMIEKKLLSQNELIEINNALNFLLALRSEINFAVKMYWDYADSQERMDNDPLFPKDMEGSFALYEDLSREEIDQIFEHDYLNDMISPYIARKMGFDSDDSFKAELAKNKALVLMIREKVKHRAINYILTNSGIDTDINLAA